MFFFIWMFLFIKFFLLQSYLNDICMAVSSHHTYEQITITILLRLNALLRSWSWLIIISYSYHLRLSVGFQWHFSQFSMQKPSSSAVGCAHVCPQTWRESFTVPGKQRRSNDDSQNIYRKIEQLVGTRMGYIWKALWWRLGTFGNSCWGPMRVPWKANTVLWAPVRVSFGNPSWWPGDLWYLWVPLTSHTNELRSKSHTALLLSAALAQ